MFQHHSLFSVCLYVWEGFSGKLWRFLLEPQYIGGPPLPVFCSVLIRSLNFIVFMCLVYFVAAWVIHELFVVECNVRYWICILLRPSWRLNVADPSVDSVDVLVLIKSLTVKFLGMEWHWYRIFISDYQMFSLCLSVNRNVLSWNTNRIKVNRSSHRTVQVIRLCFWMYRLRILTVTHSNPTRGFLYLLVCKGSCWGSSFNWSRQLNSRSFVFCIHLFNH